MNAPIEIYEVNAARVDGLGFWLGTASSTR